MKLIRICVLSLILILVFAVPMSRADSSTNDSLSNAESMDVGSITGDVDNFDEDYYRITVPGGKDLVITAEMTEGSMITVQGYEPDMTEMYEFDIDITLSSTGIEKEASWYNQEDTPVTVYIGVSGNGTYSVTAEFTTDTQDAMEALAEICFLGTAGMMCASIAVPLIIILFFVILVVIIIIVIVKATGKKKG